MGDAVDSHIRCAHFLGDSDGIIVDGIPQLRLH